jgi:hypothetical protein
MKLIVFTSLLLIGFFNLLGQHVGIGTNIPTESALFEVKSTNKGVLLSRMTSAQRKAISNPAQGLLVFDIDKSSIYMYDGVKWLPMLFAASEDFVPPVARKSLDGSSGDYFGYSVSISGDYAIVGLQPNPNKIGAAYIFFRNSGVWQQQAKLTANDGFVGDSFGESVSISGNEVIVGAPSSGFGAAYIFTRSGVIWMQTAKLTASDGATNDNFGFSVSISGNYVTAGAPFDDISANNDQGSTYVYFKSSGWNNNQAHQAKLLAPLGVANDYFGRSVSISGDYLIIGAPGSDNGVIADQGAAYIFGRLGVNWPNLAKISGLASANRWFGYSVSISGDYAAVGAPYNPLPIYDNNVNGSAYVFYGGGGWSNGQPWQSVLTSNNPSTSANDRFGSSVCLSGDQLIVGSFSYDVGLNTNQGNAHLYNRNGNIWSFLRTIDDTSPQYAGSFGYAVGINGYNIIISAIGKNFNTGEIYFYNTE